MKSDDQPTIESRETTDHPSELYEPVALAETIDTLDAFNYAALDRYYRDGFVAVANAFTSKEVHDALDGLDDLVMGRREGFTGIQFESKARDLLATLPLGKRLDAVRKFWGFIAYEPRLDALARHPKLRRVLDLILGEPPVLFQDMALIKPPRIGREKPWHQDHAYFDFPLGTRVVGVWIALDSATVENGCLRVLPAGHRDGPRPHSHQRDWQISDADMKGSQPVAVPLRPGGLILFDGLLPHGSPTNLSPRRRRAVQFHYHNESAKKLSQEDRLAIFESKGEDASG